MRMHNRLPRSAAYIHPQVEGAWRKSPVQGILAVRDKGVQLGGLFLVEVEKALQVPQRHNQQVTR